MKKYQTTGEQKNQFAGIYLLDYMINTPQSFSLFLDKHDEDLEPVLEWLLTKNYVEIENNEKYIPAPKARTALKLFLARYSEYLTMFDIFGAVDLKAGEFAVSSYFDFEDDESWNEYLNRNNWDDLRIAVADFKKMDPVEIVFMSFINENRFGRNESGWQFDLLLGSVWNDILDVCNTAIQWQELGYEDEQGIVPAEDVIKDIISLGTDIILETLEKEERLIKQGHLTTSGKKNSVEIPELSLSHYEKYRDPMYISPAWESFWLI